ncbi:MAG: hypothetical protein IKU77_07255 [Alistipes sp.]|nr:hypothetical protein [Alistipes sp.]
MRTKLLIAVVLLTVVCLSACSTARRVQKQEEAPMPTDSVREFVPTAPPVVILHSWREYLRK